MRRENCVVSTDANSSLNSSVRSSTAEFLDLTSFKNRSAAELIWVLDAKRTRLMASLVTARQYEVGSLKTYSSRSS